MKAIIKRSLSGLVYVVLVFLCTTSYFSDVLEVYFNIKIEALYLYYALITFFLLGCFLEAVKMMKFNSVVYKIISFSLVALLYYLFSKSYFNQSFSYQLNLGQNICLIVLFLLAIITLFRFSEELLLDNGKLIFIAAYIGIPFSLSLVIPYSNQPLTSEVFFVFVLIWSSDTFAFLIGSKLGKRKLAPKISPNKSVEGFIGGIICTLLLGIIIEVCNIKLKGNWIVISFIIAAFAPLGDLAESKLKRMFKVKDSGNLIPGHGGVLDRLDSFIFCIVAIFAYYLIETVL